MDNTEHNAVTQWFVGLRGGQSSASKRRRRVSLRCLMPYWYSRMPLISLRIASVPSFNACMHANRLFEYGVRYWYLASCTANHPRPQEQALCFRVGYSERQPLALKAPMFALHRFRGARNLVKPETRTKKSPREESKGICNVSRHQVTHPTQAASSETDYSSSLCMLPSYKSKFEGKYGRLSS